MASFKTLTLIRVRSELGNAFQNQLLFRNRVLYRDIGIYIEFSGCDNYLVQRSVNLKSKFFWNSIAQHTNEILDKILPYEARAEFCLIFRVCFGQWSFKKKCFRDLPTFSTYIIISLKFTCSFSSTSLNSSLALSKSYSPSNLRGSFLGLAVGRPGWKPPRPPPRPR